MLKIDQSFVRDMLLDPEDLAILDGVIGLAGAFRRQVIAEGVESAEHGRLLLRLGCVLAQGYAIARPMPAEQVAGWIQTWQPPDDWRACAPVSRDDTAILFAAVEHRAWVKTLLGFLNGKQDKAPPLDSHQCRFGHWLHKVGRSRYAQHSALPEIDHLHESIHEAAQAACSTALPGEVNAQASQIERIKALCEALQAKIEQLLR